MSTEQETPPEQLTFNIDPRVTLGACRICCRPDTVPLIGGRCMDCERDKLSPGEFAARFADREPKP